MDSLGWQIKHALRMVVSGSGAYLLVFSLGLQVDFSAVITAIFVTQSNVGGSYRVAVEQFFAAIASAICGAGAAALILPQDPASTAIALVIALTPLALLGARSPGFRVAPISAVIILLEGPGFELHTLTLALDRVLGVALGCGAGVVVSLTVFPARALSAAVETAGRVTALLARQMQILSRNEPSLRGEHGALAAQVRENLVRLDELVEEAEHERRGRSTRYSGTPRLLRALRRLRHDTDMLRRAGRDISSDALPASIATPWCEAAGSAAKTLRGIERLLAGGKVPEDFDTLTPAVRAYLGTLEDIRKSGEAATLPPATLRRMFGIGFTLDQFRRDIGDMIEIAQEVPKPRPGLVAAMKGWRSARG
ncbi:FUSC family protein [Primorskyibacter flagellatus]|uniref:Fusaric acid resistance protein family protein n=1 Tax=Primorskyibacter flagellatus TaxID=1387277 RepID=A0A1W2EII3_9RHOB|nr:FUSC family protein [Primorskyibacter flagellatus]SMD09511.1 Fusaric acid resistance protein family protein [Primorskyibacter flagellatus]